MKLHDPTSPFADVITRRRRERAALNAERFRLGVHGAPCTPPSAGQPSAALGASAWALKPERVERTLMHLGSLGGLLTDLGYKVCTIGSLAEADARPSLVAWVCGDETRSDEYDQLVALDAPGLSIGACVDDLDTWSNIEPEDHPDPIDFIRAVLNEIRWLTGGDTTDELQSTREASTVSSTVQADTGAHEVVRSGTTERQKPQVKGTI